MSADFKTDIHLNFAKLFNFTFLNYLKFFQSKQVAIVAQVNDVAHAPLVQVLELMLLISTFVSSMYVVMNKVKYVVP